MSRADAKVVAVVQARMSSQRLPGKVLAEIGGRPALGLVFSRLARCNELSAIVLATSTGADDDPVAKVAERAGVAVHRGSLDDVLARFAGVVSTLEADGVVRITGDCPFVEPTLVDRLVGIWRGGAADYVTNVLEPRTFPKGLDVEVLSAGAIRAAEAEAVDPADREHVTSFVRSRPERFLARGLWMKPEMAAVRITLDTVEDLARLRSLATELGPDPGLGSIIAALGGPAEPVISELPPPGAFGAR